MYYTYMCEYNCKSCNVYMYFICLFVNALTTSETHVQTMVNVINAFTI